MTKRSPLRTQIQDAWEDTIREKYLNHLINSERGLQVYFCEALLRKIKGADRRIFIEPRMSAIGDYKYPDIVICNSRNIIGVVELKYLPRGDAEYEKDIDSLTWLLKNSENLSLTNERFLGKDHEQHKFFLAEDAVLCWAGVYKAENDEQSPSSFPLKSVEIANIKTNFLGLHAVTKHGCDPVIHAA
jgi:hypothetical protein